MSDETPAPDTAPADGAPSTPAARPRRRAAGRPAGPPAPAPETPAEAPAEQAAEATAADEAAAPAKKTAAKKAAKKAPAKKAAAKKTAKKAPAAETAEAAEAPAEPAGDESPAEKPAKRTRSRKTAAPAFSAPADEAPAAEAPAAPAAGMLLFQAPSVEAAPTRRTRSRKAAEPAPEPEAVEAEELEDEEAVDADADAAAEADADTDEQTDEQAEGEGGARRRRRRGGRGRRRRTGGESDGADDAEGESDADAEQSEDSDSDVSDSDDAGEGGSSRRRRRRRRRGGSGDDEGSDDPPNTVVRVREPRSRTSSSDVTAVKGSTRLEAKKQRRREGREAGRRRPSILTEAEFLARREAVERVMVVRQRDDRTQIAVLEDDVLVEHYVNRNTGASMIGNVYLGKVQNVLPSMEAAFVDIGRGRNAVLYAGEVNWDAAGLEGQPKRIEAALKPGDPVLVQVSKDPLGHKGARLTAQISLPGRFLVYVPEGQMTGISRKLPDTERSRLKAILRQVVPEDAGVIVRTAAEGASEEELRRDVERLAGQWAEIQEKVASAGGGPALLHGEPDLAIKVVRDIFNEDFTKLVVEGSDIAATIQDYVGSVAPDLAERVQPWTGPGDLFTELRIDEQLAKALDRKVWLPSGGSLVIDRTEAMTVVDVNTGKFTGQGGNLEETVTRNNLEAAEEIVRQLRLRDIGGIVVIDFIDMVLESNRDLVLRRLVECLGRDRTKHQVAEVTSLGLVQMTRKRIGQGLLEVFSETCEACSGRGYHIHSEPVAAKNAPKDEEPAGAGARSRKRKGKGGDAKEAPAEPKGKAEEPRAIDPKVSEAMEKIHAAAAKRAAEAAAAAAGEAAEHQAEAAEAEAEAGTEGDLDVAAAVAVLDAAEAADAVEAVEAAEAAGEPAAAPSASSGTGSTTPVRRKRGPRKATRKAGPAV
jgi:ribonuclease E